MPLLFHHFYFRTCSNWYGCGWVILLFSPYNTLILMTFLISPFHVNLNHFAFLITMTTAMRNKHQLSLIVKNSLSFLSSCITLSSSLVFVPKNRQSSMKTRKILLLPNIINVLSPLVLKPRLSYSRERKLNHYSGY